MVIFYMVVSYHDVINAFHFHYLVWASCLVSCRQLFIWAPRYYQHHVCHS